MYSEGELKDHVQLRVNEESSTEAGGDAKNGGSYDDHEGLVEVKA